MCSCVGKSAMFYKRTPLQLKASGDIRWSEELFKYDIHAAKHLGKKKIVAGFVHGALSFIKSLGSR